MHVIKQNPKGETEEKGRDSYEKMDEKKNPEEAAARKEAKKEAAEEMKDMLDMEED